MPFVTISVFRGIRPMAINMEICKQIQQAVKIALRIEHDNFHHRIHEYEKTEMCVPSVSSDKYIAIEIQFMSRRNADDKEKMYRLIQDKLIDYGIHEKDTMIIINDPPLENWYIRGKTGLELTNSK